MRQPLTWVRISDGAIPPPAIAEALWSQCAPGTVAARKLFADEQYELRGHGAAKISVQEVDTRTRDSG